MALFPVIDLGKPSLVNQNYTPVLARLLKEMDPAGPPMKKARTDSVCTLGWHILGTQRFINIESYGMAFGCFMS